jgi:hypothetical protein
MDDWFPFPIIKALCGPDGDPVFCFVFTPILIIFAAPIYCMFLAAFGFIVLGPISLILDCCCPLKRTEYVEIV